MEAIRTRYKERDVQVIVNFAAESHVDRSIENPIPFYDTNVIGTVTLLELVKNIRI